LVTKQVEQAPDGFCLRIVSRYGRPCPRWVCERCGHDYIPGQPAAWSHLTWETTRGFLEQLVDLLAYRGPTNAVLINRAADEAGVSRGSLSNQRRQWREQGILAYDSYVDLAEKHGISLKLAHFWRLPRQTPLTEQTALNSMREIEGRR
jgi:hypothetical protein